MATQTTTTTGGYIDKIEGSLLFTWNDVRNSTTGTIVGVNPSSSGILARYVSSGRGAGFRIQRTYLAFDLSSVTGTITDITLVLTTNIVYDDVIVVESTAPGLATNLTTSDFGDVNFSITYSSAYTLISSSTNSITLNSNAISDANTNGELILGVINYDYDYLNVQPPDSLSNPSQIQYSLGTAPYLSYTAVTGYGNTVIGVISANIGEVNGVATADIGNIIGV